MIVKTHNNPMIKFDMQMLDKGFTNYRQFFHQDIRPFSKQQVSHKPVKHQIIEGGPGVTIPSKFKGRIYQTEDEEIAELKTKANGLELKDYVSKRTQK